MHCCFVYSVVGSTDPLKPSPSAMAVPFSQSSGYSEPACAVGGFSVLRASDGFAGRKSVNRGFWSGGDRRSERGARARSARVSAAGVGAGRRW
jgi:hypothetical protein